MRTRYRAALIALMLVAPALDAQPVRVGVAAPEIERRVREVATKLGIEHLLRKKPAQLSGGERQRVALGRALIRRLSLSVPRSCACTFTPKRSMSLAIPPI